MTTPADGILGDRGVRSAVPVALDAYPAGDAAAAGTADTDAVAPLPTDAPAAIEEIAARTTADRGSRYRRIAAVLGQHGLGFLVAGLGIDHLMPFDHGDGARVTGPEARAREVREALEELGPTFVKLGQLLATRRDLLPVAYIRELEKLQDSGVPVPTSTVLRTIEDEFGAPPSVLFASFESEPLACASLGQAHAAILRDGTPVVVKVRRPEAAATVEQDLGILHNLADRAGRYLHDAGGYDFPALADEFAKSLRAELDYVREGRSAERFAADFADDPDIRIPRVFWETTSTRVLTLERMTGIKVDDLEALDSAHLDRPAIMRRAIDAIARMVFVDGFFHADPHPGNLFIQPGGRIALIDFGMVGTLDGPLRDRLGALIVAVSRKDPDRVGSALTELSHSRRPRDAELLRDDVVGLMAMYQGRSLGEVEMTPLLVRLLSVLRRHGLHLPADLALLVRMLLLVDTVGARLDPTFNLAAALAPYATQLAAKHLSLRALATRAGHAGLDAAALGLELPERLRRLLERMDGDGLQLHLRASELDPLVARMERVGNRVVAGMIAAALIGGVGRLTAGATGPSRSLRAPLLDSGLGMIGVLGAYLAVTARRHRL